MEQGKEERRAVDIRLLSEAIVELNISRRSVGLYRRDHPITKGALEKTYRFFEKLFEVRQSITLGITKDTLMVDEQTFDPKNAAFRDFSKALYDKGIAAIEFRLGMTLEELLLLHEAITARNAGLGKSLVEYSEQKGLRHIRLFGLDVSQFGLIKDARREASSEDMLLDDYVRGLIDGRFPKAELDGMLLVLGEEKVAHAMNRTLSVNTPVEAYDKVVTSYLKGGAGRQEFVPRFTTLIRHLDPAIKERLLTQTFRTAVDTEELTSLIKELKLADFEMAVKLLSEQQTVLPEHLRNLVDKMAEVKRQSGYFDLLIGGQGIVDDIVLDEETIKQFGEDRSKDFVSRSYQWELGRMVKGVRVRESALLDEARNELRDAHTDRVMTEIVFELLESEYMTKHEALRLLTRLTEVVDDFIDTGRFAVIGDIYNALYSRSLSGPFREETSDMIRYYFYAGPFISRFVDAVRLWGVHDEEGLLRIAGLLKHRLIEPLLNALAEEEDMSARMLFIKVLSSFRSDVLPEAVRRLNDERWYVVRNMICLIRECGGSKYVGHVRPFAQSTERRISMEAVQTLLHFKDSTGIRYLRSFLSDEDPDIRDKAMKFAGLYRIREVVPDLLTLFEKRDFLQKALPLKRSIIRVLGDIGDPRALAVLKGFYGSRPLLFKNAVDDLKTEFFRTLRQYPLGAAKPFADLGRRSSNPEIRAISERLLKDKGG